MINFHGHSKKKRYFEGWYFKHQKGADIISFIPGIHVNGEGSREAFIQVLAGSESFYFPFPFEEFSASKRELQIKIGKNEFSQNGISLDIDQDGEQIKGQVVYGNLSPIAYNIMGPFSPLPMECNHAIHSLGHFLQGFITVRERTYDFTGGTGYIEQDYGKSFPLEYIWMQTNDLEGKEGCLFVSIAKVPFLGFAFTGCISVLYLNGKEYRLATYLGVRILSASDRYVHLQQGKHLLEIDMEESEAHPLLAPAGGEMSRTIRESSSTPARIRFHENGALLLDARSNTVSFEYVK